MMDRRTLLAGMGGTAAAAAVADQGTPPSAAPLAAAPFAPARPDVGFLRTEALVHAERAQAVMAREQFDAFIVTQPANVFYLGNHWPNLDRMGFRHSVFVVYPRDPKRPVALVMTGFLHYYRYADDVDLPNRIVFPYTSPVGAAAASAGSGAGGGEPEAAPTRLHRVLDATLLTPREKHRRSVAASAEPPSASAERALLKAVRHLGLEKGRIAIDDPVVERLLVGQGFAGSFAPAEDSLRRIRLVKSPPEIRLMRIAAQNNVDAALATVGAVRAAGSTGALRNR
jgi:Xaa-Pro aminopeptidase